MSAETQTEAEDATRDKETHMDFRARTDKTFAEIRAEFTVAKKTCQEALAAAEEALATAKAADTMASSTFEAIERVNKGMEEMGVIVSRDISIAQSEIQVLGDGIELVGHKYDNLKSDLEAVIDAKSLFEASVKREVRSYIEVELAKIQAMSKQRGESQDSQASWNRGFDMDASDGTTNVNIGLPTKAMQEPPPCFDLPAKPFSAERSHRKSIDEVNAYFVHLPNDAKILGTKWVDPPLLKVGETTQWKIDIESFVRRLSPDGHMVNVMFGTQRYHASKHQATASIIIFDVLMFAIKPMNYIHSISPSVRKRRDGIALAREVWSKLDSTATYDKRATLKTKWEQHNVGFNQCGTIIHAMNEKFALVDEVNDLTVEGSTHRVIEEVEIVDTILGFLPETDFWITVRDYFSLNPNKKTRFELYMKLEQRCAMVPKQAYGAKDDGYGAEEVSNAAWKGKPSGRSKNYGSGEFKAASLMSDKDKLDMLIKYLKTLDRVPLLEYKDYQNFLKFCVDNHKANGASVDECMHKFVDAHVAYMDKEEQPGYYHPDLIKAAMAALADKREADVVGGGADVESIEDNSSGDESIDAGAASTHGKEPMNFYEFWDYAEGCFESKKSAYVTSVGALRHNEQGLIKMAKNGDNAAIYLAYMESLGDYSAYATDFG